MNDFFKYEKEIYCEDTKETCFGYDEYLKSNHWKNLRTRLIGDNRVCAICKQRKSAIQLHHLNYERLGNENDSDVIPVCTRCHKNMHNSKSFSIKNIYDMMFEYNNGGYICVNKALMHNLGNDAAIVYAELVRSYLYYEKQGDLTSDGAFFCTVEALEDQCNVSRGQQQRIFKRLENAGLLKCDYRGLPKRRYIILLADKISVSTALSKPKREPKAKLVIPDEVIQKYMSCDCND